MLNNELKMTSFVENCKKAAKQLVWENERKVLDDMIKEIDG